MLSFWLQTAARVLPPETRRVSFPLLVQGKDLASCGVLLATCVSYHRLALILSQNIPFQDVEVGAVWPADGLLCHACRLDFSWPPRTQMSPALRRTACQCSALPCMPASCLPPEANYQRSNAISSGLLIRQHSLCHCLFDLFRLQGSAPAAACEGLRMLHPCLTYASKYTLK